VTDWAHDLQWNAISYLVVATAALVTLAALWTLIPALRKRWLPMQRLRPGRWTGNDVFLSLCIGIGMPEFVALLLLQIGFFGPLLGTAPDNDAPRLEQALYYLQCRLISSPLALAVVLGLLFTVLFARSGTRPNRYGLTWIRWPSNVALGIVAFILGKPLIIGIYALFLLVFPRTEDVFADFGKLNPPIWDWALLFFQTVVMAPLVEEILCRGLLQGWLRRAPLSSHLTYLSMLLFMTVFFHADDLSNGDFVPVVFTIVLVIGYGAILYQFTRKFGLDAAEIQAWQPMQNGAPLPTYNERNRRWVDANARLAIYGSATFFAVIHTSWPAAPAMFPMGLMLGWMAYRTQSLIAPITFHALFNLATFIAFYGSL
jgi:membrane protease YdiL (CAAX protease family)